MLLFFNIFLLFQINEYICTRILTKLYQSWLIKFLKIAQHAEPVLTNVQSKLFLKEIFTKLIRKFVLSAVHVLMYAR